MVGCRAGTAAGGEYRAFLTQRPDGVRLADRRRWWPACLQAALRKVRLLVGKRHLVLLRLLEAHVRFAVAAGDRWPAALASARELQPMYDLVYPHVRSPTPNNHFLSFRPATALRTCAFGSPSCAPVL